MSVPLRPKRRPVRPDALNVVRGQETRRRILDAARRRILADGYEDLRLDEVARDVGVTKGAVIKSAGGKWAILLTLAEEDRQTRIQVIDEMRSHRTGLERRLAETVRRLVRIDQPRLELIMAFVGYLWFWTGDEQRRAQAMIDDTRTRLCQLLVEASTTPLSDDRVETLSRRVVAGYAMGLRDLYLRKKRLDDVVRFVVDFALD
jgi:AcrR family transcriptional regulator